MFEGKHSPSSGRSRKGMAPPMAHAASASPFRQPLDLAALTAASAATMDLHAALSSLPSAAYGLSHITTPPAVPPPSSKFWDTPPPQLAALKAPTPPSSVSHTRTTSPAPAATSSAAAPTISSLSAASASTTQNDSAWNTNQTAHLLASSTPSTKYSQLLLVLEELGKDVRPSYAGSKSSAERLKRGITHARVLVREALIEVERASK